MEAPLEKREVDHRQLVVKQRRHVECKNCGNDNLIHGLVLAKADNVMMMGGPGQQPPLIGHVFAMYMCPKCMAFYPYPKHYPANRGIQTIYQQVIAWCDEQVEQRRSIEETIKQLNSIIEASKEMVGLGGLQKDELIQQALGPLWDELTKLREELKRRRGGRPRKGTNNATDS